MRSVLTPEVGFSEFRNDPWSENFRSESRANLDEPEFAIQYGCAFWQHWVTAVHRCQCQPLGLLFVSSTSCTGSIVQGQLNNNNNNVHLAFPMNKWNVVHSKRPSFLAPYSHFRGKWNALVFPPTVFCFVFFFFPRLSEKPVQLKCPMPLAFAILRTGLVYI